jgi:transposase InsO family protein
VQNWGAQALECVYLIPRLTANIVSLGQLEEDGHKIVLHVGSLKIWDWRDRMVSKGQRSTNRLYVLHLNVDRPIYLAVQGESPAWRWHARYGHLNFRGLRRLVIEEMVNGLPQIDHVDQICDSYLARKQQRLSFPGEAKYQAVSKLELVHGDLCGPITLATLSGKKYFFLLIDDLSRYMWLTLLAMKDEATTTFKAFQARAEAETRKKLGTLHTDHSGEFTARDFLNHCTRQGVQCHLTAPYSLEQNRIVER